MDALSNVDPFNFRYKDKAVHFCFYFLFTVFWYLFFQRLKNRAKSRVRLTVFILATIYGACIELCQWLFTTGRTADMVDIAANMGGSTLAIICLWLFSKIK
ncbi:hypothetical protein CHU92_06330 [Flavobacterium cyanobacteriorum]|uniref:VanZ-like domain-containing protein n=2 Tax=Flavobacterium cyanobacteriorum TaxID=2022802 RepID=A0A255Z9E6_9FLAO|nr:hypothetical protein CHU92_06330 [Flavobacterium cyanobacteriorum]